MERTFVMIKPDAVQRGFVGRIITRFEDKGLKLVAINMAMPDREHIERLYAAHAGSSFYDALIEFTISSPVVAMVVEGKNAVEVVRRMVGARAGTEAQPGTIRGDFSITDGNRNLVHASDSVENARREMAIFFQELPEYDLTTKSWL